jgi:hypothetical protein
MFKRPPRRDGHPSVETQGRDELPKPEAFGADDEWDDIRTRVALFGSHEAVDAYEAVRKALGTYFAHSPEDGKFKEWPSKAFIEIAERHIATVSARIKELEAVMRDDLI